MTGQNKFLLTSQISVIVTEVSIDWSEIFFFHQSIIHSVCSVLPGLSIDNSKKFFIRQSILVFVFSWSFLFWVVLVGEFFFSDGHVIDLEHLVVVGPRTVLVAYCVSRILLYKILENHIG